MFSFLWNWAIGIHSYEIFLLQFLWTKKKGRKKNLWKLNPTKFLGQSFNPRGSLGPVWNRGFLQEFWRKSISIVCWHHLVFGIEDSRLSFQNPVRTRVFAEVRGKSPSLTERESAGFDGWTVPWWCTGWTASKVCEDNAPVTILFPFNNH